MFDLKDIRVREYLRLPIDEVARYIELQKVLKGKPEFCGNRAKELRKLSYGQVKMIGKRLANPSFDDLADIFKLVFDVSREKILRANIVEFFYAINWISKNLITLVENERKLLRTEMDPMLEAAGVERLMPFSELSVLLDLGKKFGMHPEEVEKWNYSLVLSILVHDKIFGEVKKEYDRLKSK